VHIPTHILSGWCLASVLPLNKRERLFCMLAASLPDFDGLGILVSEELYWDYHHYAGHNVFFGLLLSAAFAAFSARKGLAFIACLACFHLHLAMDFIGSGQGWLIHYFWPADDRGFKTDIGWPLDSWQNRVAFGLLLLATIAIGYWRRITPLELLAPRIDRWLTGTPEGGNTNPHESDESARMRDSSAS
jgi:hypothetical protein